MMCHRRCLAKISRHCPTSVPGKGVEACSPQILGEDLSRSANVTELAPMIMEMLLRHIELNGLCTEGIYRIPGAASQVRKLRQQLENDPRAVCLGEFDVHTVTGLIKQWLRQLPEPLVPFEHYSGLLHAMELPETSQLAHIYEMLDMLPFAHLRILERLISHMVRVASEEASNCMSLHALAIIFAPCLLRSPQSVDLLQAMAEMMKATACLELILNEQMRRQKEFMEPEGKTL